MPPNLIRDRAGTPPYLQPYLHALDRMQKREFLRPDQLVERARALLVERLGASTRPAEAAFAHAGMGMPGEHAHYFDGFALVLLLPLGAAVAVRTAEAPFSRVVFDDHDAMWPFDRSRPAPDGPDAPAWVRVIQELSRRLGPRDIQIDVAVATTVQSTCVDAYLAAVAVAAARTLQALLALSTDRRALLEAARAAVEAAHAPFGIAFLMAADAGRADAFALVDTATFEQILLDVPERDVLGWGLVDVGTGPLRDADFYRKRRALTDEATEVLRRKVFPGLASLRDLEHRDLQRALDLLPRRFRPVVRHLVTENRRVQRMVAAVRQRDWQMIGALLLMSHASRRNDFESTSEETDLVVAQVEAMSLEGMYGACATGRGGCVLVTGQPFTVPHCLDRATAALEERFGVTPDVMLL